MSIFNRIKVSKVGSSTFNLSYDHKTTANFGSLFPVNLKEVLPGDVFTQKTSLLMRLMALKSPIFQDVDVYVHHFFVPTRLLWDNWEEFITGSYNTDPAPAVPYFNASLVNGTAYTNSLLDYFGISEFTLPVSGPSISALPFAAYNFIWNEYYRDENLQDELPYKLDDGDITLMTGFDASDWTTVRKRAWLHDYFTSALPFAQKGPDVTLPVGSFDDVEVTTQSGEASFEMFDGSAPFSGDAKFDATTNPKRLQDFSGSPVHPSDWIAKTSDLTYSSTKIRELRRALKLQEWLEKNARGGTRYVESILQHFGVHTGDYRLDRPVYLGGSKSPAKISQVLQTSATQTGDTPQANPAGYGVAFSGGRGFSNYKVKEHGYIMSIASVIPKASYMNGLPRMFSRRENLDYYFPSFQNIGEQAIANKELFIDSSNPDGEFGYIPRYAEYKYSPSIVSGEFRNTLKYWHLGRDFATEPSLNKSFIECNPSTRIFATTEADNHLMFNFHHDIKAVRKMQKFGNPYL